MQQKEPDLLRVVLSEIRSGRSVFRPATSDEDGLRAFQRIAQALVHASRTGLIQSCKPHEERTTRHRWTDCVFVGRLTYEGAELLRDTSPAAPVQHAAADEILQVRPSFCGVTLDVKALFRWIKQKFLN